MSDFDVLIVGAGAAGLAALRDLDRAGLRVLVLEARDRIGGRIYTVHDALSSLPVELGAEFVHGRPPELLHIIRDAGLSIYDGTDASRYINQGKVEAQANSWNLVDSVLEDMRKAANKQDQSFEDFLDSTSYDEETCQAARSYIEGFNAADSRQIGIQALSEETIAADQIDGDRVFRFFDGYAAVPIHLWRSVPDCAAKLRLNSVVERIDWQPGAVSVHTRNALSGEPQTWSASTAIVTVPLGVLHAGKILFSPEPTETLAAANRLRYGQVFRVVFRFRHAFWEQREDLKDAGFLLSRELMFPTWWTTLAARSTLLVGWHAGARSVKMQGMTRNEILSAALMSLSKIMDVPLQIVRSLLEGAYFHNWQTDPYSLGAYSYVPAGALAARKQMALPVADTLFFAGEATDQAGHSATVHGAIASGRRAAGQVIDSVRLRVV